MEKEENEDLVSSFPIGDFEADRLEYINPVYRNLSPASKAKWLFKREKSATLL